MADQVVGLEIRANGEQAVKSVGDIRRQLREAQREVISISEEFGELSPQALQAAKRVAELRDRIADANERIELFNPAKKFGAFSDALSAAAGGFTALTGAAALFGAESEDLQKTLVKVQAALALSQGLSAIADAGKYFERLKVVALDALKGIKAGIAATGIGLFAVAIGTIVAYWEDIKALVNGVTAEQNKLNQASEANLNLQKEKLSSISSQDNILKLQGKSEAEILQIKIKQIDATIAATKEVIRNGEITRKLQEAAAQRNFDFLKGYLDLVSLPIRAITKLGIDAINGLIGLINKIPGIDIPLKINGDFVDQSTGFLAKLIFDPEETRRKGEEDAKARQDELLKLENDRAGLILAQRNADKAIVQSNKKANEQKAKDNFLFRSKELDDIEKFNKEMLRLQAEAEAKAAEQQKQQTELFKTLQLERLSGIALERQKIFDEYQERLKIAGDNSLLLFEVEEQYRKKKAELDKQAADERLANERALQEGRIQIISNALEALSELVGRETVAGKALAVAQATIDGFLAVQKALASAPPPFNFIAAATVGAATLANVRKIIATKIPGKGGGAPVGQVPSFQAPPIPEPQRATTQLDQNSLNQIGNATTRAFVVESDVSSSQERIRRLNRAARLT
jgi:hypothetical protein